MKRVLVVIGATLGVLVICIGLFFLGRWIADDSFKLNDKYYGSAKYLDLDKDKLDKLIKDKESFVVFVYQPLCAASSQLESVVAPFMHSYDISFYKISYVDMKNTKLKDTVKYYPSIVIYKEGEVVDFLDANSGEDTDVYKDIESFTDWFKDYVKIKKVKEAKADELEIDESTKKDAVIENITYSEDKMNIYFFWGDGCPHCKHAFKFFEEIEEMYGEKFDLHSFEVWHNKDNLDLMATLCGELKHKIGGVPLIIVGDKVYEGFGEEAKAKILNSILDQYQNSYDVYFETLKD